MEISKSAVLFANEHQSDQKYVTNYFSITSRSVFVHAKRLCQWNVRKCSIKKDFNQNGSLSIS